MVSSLPQKANKIARLFETKYWNGPSKICGIQPIKCFEVTIQTEHSTSKF